MRKVSIIFGLFLFFFFLSCSSDPDSKTITPTSIEFTSGELARYIEVVDQPSELTFTQKEDGIETQFISLKVTLKMIKDGLKSADARDIDFTGLLSVAIINLVDENGTEVIDLSIKSGEILKLKKLLVGDKDDTAEIVFEGKFHNSEDSPKWFENAKQFTPYLTGDIYVNENHAKEELSNVENDEQNLTMTGYIYKYPITMSLEIKGQIVKGSYYYDKSGPNAILKLSGMNDDGTLDINETDENGTPTGHFVGTLSNGEFRGTFKTNKGKSMPFAVSENGAEPCTDQDSPSSESNLETYEVTSSGDSEDWDALLDSYEKYVDKYISYMKKAANGDMSALSEYPALMEQAQDYSEKLQNAKADLSSSQWSRYMKITNKMLQAAQNM